MFGALAGLGSALAWSISTLLFARVGAQVRPLAINAFKCTLALGVLGGVLVATGGLAWPGTTPALLLAGSALTGLTFGDWAHFLALERLGPRRTLTLAALTPPVTALLASARLGEHLPWLAWAGMAVTLAGVCLVLWERAKGGGTLSRSGLAWGAVALGLNAVANVLAREGGYGLSGLQVTVARLVVGAGGLWVVLLVTGRVGEVIAPLRTPSVRGRLVLASLVGTCLGIWLYMVGIGAIGPGITATLGATSPVFVLVISRFVFHEPVTARGLFGTFAAVAGVALLVYATTPSRAGSSPGEPSSGPSSVAAP